MGIFAVGIPPVMEMVSSIFFPQAFTLHGIWSVQLITVLASLSESGVLDALIAEGRTIAFVSNIDNTGAVFDFRLAKAMTDGVADYMMEVLWIKIWV